MRKAQQIAAESAKKTRPLHRTREKISLEIRLLHEKIEADQKQLEALLLKEDAAIKEIETAEADAIKTLGAMAQPGDAAG